MTAERLDHGIDPASESKPTPGPRTVSASRLGLSLRIRDETLKEYERIREKTINEAEDRNFSWR